MYRLYKILHNTDSILNENLYICYFTMSLEAQCEYAIYLWDNIKILNYNLTS